MISVIDRRIPLIGVLLSATCLAYFYALDRVLFSSTHFSPIFRLLLTVDDFRAAWLGLAICLLAAVWNPPARILRLVDLLGNHARFFTLASVAMIVLAAVIVYHGYPLSMDEYAAVFQSKIFASGHLAARLPRDLMDWLVVRGFNGEFLVASRETGRVVEQYWPGFALLLTPFEYFKVPWLCNASLAGLALVLIHWITRQITGDPRAAGWALLFTAASGVFVADAISYYSMQAHLTANLLFVALLLKPTGRRVLGAGLVGSLALNLHNPVPHALFAIPWMLAMTQRGQRRYLMPLVLGYLPGVALGVAWILLRRDIGSVPDMSPLHEVTTGVFSWPDSTLLNMRTAALVKMWVWMPPGLLVVAVLGCLRRRDHPKVRLLMQSAVLTFVGYLFVRFDQGHGWGYRYFYSAWGAVPILAACAMSDRASTNEGEARYPRLTVFAGAAAMLNLLLVMPFQLHQISEFITQHRAQLPVPRRPGNNVYFIHPRGGFYVADMVQIDPLLRDPDLLLVSRGAELDAQLIRQNWPGAVELAGAPAADHWYLGAQDRRVPIPGSKDQKRFVICLSLCPPSAADR